jgi:chemosensory pili system protein ChpA (sensor histidine kinase/response regulator)
LKGSGRLVGAKVIGELAWAVENMLNRLIDETIKVSPDMMDLLNRVSDSLPELINCQEKGVYPNLDVEFLQRQAYALAEGKPMPAADLEQPERVEETAVEELSQEIDKQPSEITEEILSPIEEDEQAPVLDTASNPEFETILDELSSLELDMGQPEVSGQEPEPSTDSDLSARELVADLDEIVAQQTVEEDALEDFSDSDLEIEIDSEYSMFSVRSPRNIYWRSSSLSMGLRARRRRY